MFSKCVRCNLLIVTYFVINTAFSTFFVAFCKKAKIPRFSHIVSTVWLLTTKQLSDLECVQKQSTVSNDFTQCVWLDLDRDTKCKCQMYFFGVLKTKEADPITFYVAKQKLKAIRADAFWTVDEMK